MYFVELEYFLVFGTAFCCHDVDGILMCLKQFLYKDNTASWRSYRYEGFPIHGKMVSILQQGPGHYTCRSTNLYMPKTNFPTSGLPHRKQRLMDAANPYSPWPSFSKWTDAHQITWRSKASWLGVTMISSLRNLISTPLQIWTNIARVVQ